VITSAVYDYICPRDWAGKAITLIVAPFSLLASLLRLRTEIRLDTSVSCFYLNGETSEFGSFLSKYVREQKADICLMNISEVR
jgi:hypothetical protein